MFGYCYEYGEGVAKDLAKAAEWYRKSAEQGNATAQYTLAIFYKNGYGVTQNKAEAAKWYKKAAEQGDANAQNSLGYCYDHGEGVEKNSAKAVEWYERAQSKVINSRSTIWGFVMSTEMVQRKTLEERRNGTANLQNKAMQLHSTSSVAVISTEMA